MILSHISGNLENEYGVEVFEGNGEIYLGDEIQKASNEFIDRGDISSTGPALLLGRR